MVLLMLETSIPAPRYSIAACMIPLMWGPNARNSAEPIRDRGVEYCTEHEKGENFGGGTSPAQILSYNALDGEMFAVLAMIPPHSMPARACDAYELTFSPPKTLARFFYSLELMA